MFTKVECIFNFCKILEICQTFKNTQQHYSAKISVTYLQLQESTAEKITQHYQTIFNSTQQSLSVIIITYDLHHRAFAECINVFGCNICTHFKGKSGWRSPFTFFGASTW